MTGAPSWTRTNIVGLEGRLPVRRPGRIRAGKRSRTVPCLVGKRRRCAHVIGSRRSICTCYLRLIGSVRICMSFAAIEWSGRQDLHLRLPSSRLGCLLLTYVLKWTRRQELHLREVALQATA